VSERVDPYVLPPDLPVPHDDGAADHLLGARAPRISLPSTAGPELDVSAEAEGTLVLYVYPRTGRPGHALPPHWNQIPGARGCTPQACAYRDRFSELEALGARVLGLSAQPLGDQLEFSARVGLPYPLLSDPGLVLGDALGLPEFTVADMRLYRRLTLVFRQGEVAKVLYPVFPPDADAENVIGWLREARAA
jgi:peroxiredoxin